MRQVFERKVGVPLAVKLNWLKEYQRRGALWLHDSDPLRPHALLSSGRHSSGFFNSGVVLQAPVLQDFAAKDLVKLALMEGLDIARPDRVVGPAMGAITLAHDLARRVQYKRYRECYFSFAEKEGDPPNQRMVFRRVPVREGEFVLLCEDVITTGGSVDQMVSAVKLEGGIPLPFILALVNRSGGTHLNGRQIIALINEPMPTWGPRECPLCAEGSEAISPKGRANWQRLTADNC